MKYILITIACVFTFSSLTYCQIESCYVNGLDYCEELDNLIERCKKGGASESEVNDLTNFMTFFLDSPKASDYERMEDIGENLLYNSHLGRFGLDSTLKKSLKIINDTLNTVGVSQQTKGSGTSPKKQSNMRLYELILPGVILLILSLLIAYSRYQVYTLENEKESLQDELKNYRERDRKKNQKIEDFKKGERNLEWENRELQGKVTSLKNQIDELKIKSYKKQVITREEKSSFSSSRETLPYKSTSPKYETYYLSAPNEDGSFKVKSVSPVQTYHSYYKLIKINERKAEFEITNDKDLQLKAIDSYDRLIAPVCENDNMFDSNKTKMQQITRGELALQGDIWKVTKKCKVRYI